VLKRTVESVASSLGLSDGAAGSIQARLYKLLLYEQGGHFSAHQDTEKERGMIGTLVVQLPTAQGHTGGALTVRHKGRSFTHHFEKVCNLDNQLGKLSVLPGTKSPLLFVCCMLSWRLAAFQLQKPAKMPTHYVPSRSWQRCACLSECPLTHRILIPSVLLGHD